jgi:hypothetical protein
VDAWRNAILDVFATEGENRIARRLRALSVRVRNLFTAPADLAEIRLQDIPLEFPHAAARRVGSMDTLVQGDWETVAARENSPAAMQAESIRRQSFDVDLPNRFGRGGFRAPPRTPRIPIPR